MNLEFILQQEFPHKKLHDTTNNNGCAARVLGEAYVFLENLISFGNITLVDLCECCWHCKKAIEETEIIEGQKTHSYTCSLNYDNHLAAYIAEINRVVVHELVHLCCGFSEEQVCKITFAVMGSWDSCRYYEDKEVKKHK